MSEAQSTYSFCNDLRGGIRPRIFAQKRDCKRAREDRAIFNDLMGGPIKGRPPRCQTGIILPASPFRRP